HLDLGKRVLGGGCHQTSDQRCHPPRAVEGDRFPSPLDVGVGKPVPHATVDVAVHQAGYHPTAADVMGVARYLVVRTQGSHAAVLDPQPPLVHSARSHDAGIGEGKGSGGHEELSSASWMGLAEGYRRGGWAALPV